QRSNRIRPMPWANGAPEVRPYGRGRTSGAPLAHRHPLFRHLPAHPSPPPVAAIVRPPPGCHRSSSEVVDTIALLGQGCPVLRTGCPVPSPGEGGSSSSLDGPAAAAAFARVRRVCKPREQTDPHCPG